MLEQTDLSRSLPKKSYKSRLPSLQNRLHQLQQACWEANLASVLVVEGWDAAGKGSTIRKLTERLEPRGFDVHTTVAARSAEQQLPPLWPFWRKVPDYGHMAIFHRSWYSRVLMERVEGLEASAAWRAYEDITSFERALADDRYCIVKLFLHIDKKEQRRRLQKLKKAERSTWQVEALAQEPHEKYDAYLVAVEEMLERTETEWAPWTVVEATDKRWARIKVFETVIGHLEDELRKCGHEVPEPFDNF